MSQLLVYCIVLIHQLYNSVLIKSRFLQLVSNPFHHLLVTYDEFVKFPAEYPTSTGLPKLQSKVIHLPLKKEGPPWVYIDDNGSKDVESRLLCVVKALNRCPVIGHELPVPASQLSFMAFTKLLLHLTPHSGD